VVNLYGMTPAQLAAYRNQRQLSRLLMPSLSLVRVLEALDPDMPRSAQLSGGHHEAHAVLSWLSCSFDAVHA